MIIRRHVGSGLIYYLMMSKGRQHEEGGSAAVLKLVYNAFQCIHAILGGRSFRPTVRFKLIRSSEHATLSRPQQSSMIEVVISTFLDIGGRHSDTGGKWAIDTCESAQHMS